MSDVQSIPLDEILKALANPVRLDILSWLKEPENHFSDQHASGDGRVRGPVRAVRPLPVVRFCSFIRADKGGLIMPHRVGQWTFYKRDEEAIAAFIKAVSDL